MFLDSLYINHFLHRDRDENIKCKGYFAEFGQSECVYFTKMKLLTSKFLYKKYGPIIA